MPDAPAHWLMTPPGSPEPWKPCRCSIGKNHLARTEQTVEDDTSGVGSIKKKGERGE